MEIEKIIYHTTRSINNIEDKLRIATIFLFCYQLNAKKFAELLYTENHEQFISNLNTEYKEYEIDFNIRLTDKNVRDSFYDTLIKVKNKHDDDGYYKALYQNDPYAIAIDSILSYNFDLLSLKYFRKNLSKQLSFNFFEND